ncbi:retrovirus-related pol polyprotein from transposon TNT 1-94 [Tanacetum coccineum]
MPNGGSFGNEQFATNSWLWRSDARNYLLSNGFYTSKGKNNLFSVGQFVMRKLEVAFRSLRVYILDMKGKIFSQVLGTDLYSIKRQELNNANHNCLNSKATMSQAWLWHHRLSHLNFNTINLLLKNNIMNGLLKLKFVKDHLCSSYDYPDIPGTSLLEVQTPGVVIDFLTLVQRGLHAQVITAEAIATTCFTQNHSLVIPRHEKTPLTLAELPQMASDHVISDPVPQCSTTVLEQDSLSPGPQSQENVPQVAETVTTSNELELLYSPIPK